MPTPSYLDQSRQDAGETDKDRMTPGAGTRPHAKYEAAEARIGYTRVPGMAKAQPPRKTMPPQIKAAQTTPRGIMRILHLLKGGNAGRLAAQGRAMHVLSLMPGSTITPDQVNAAYEPYQKEVAKIVATYLGTAGAAGGAAAGGYKLYDNANQKGRWSRTLGALGIG